MPIRDYKCSSCGETWEELRKDQSDPESCKKCGAKDIKRLPALSNFKLKGNWYKTNKSY